MGKAKTKASSAILTKKINLGNQMIYYAPNLINVDACSNDFEIVVSYFKLVEEINGKRSEGFSFN